ncbi:phenylacetate--CoA ligase family protein [Anaeromyxobacter oryzisoli]|uniref:phenylacetate--CoA ligase family protein n=1 Tax=Anaeromyxobacter oryzisoli TaxID=2925408 RepID=UPI001F56A5AB|nr:phenylacetate--CoA ligase [Anaeromyxobacter sp. SG63]
MASSSIVARGALPPGFENRLYDPAEALPRDELSALQLRRLQETVERAARVPSYREALGRAGVSAADIRSLDDLRRLPFTVKDDLRRNYPLGLLAVPREQVVRIHGSSGTTGRPTFVAYTRRDLDTWTGLVARFLVAGGLRPEHTVHVAFGYGLFTGGFGLHYGIERVGAAVVPAGGGNTPRHVRLIQDLGAQVLICTPSYALHIGEVAAAEGLRPDDLALRFGHFGGEPWTEELRQEIERSLGILAFNNYGLSEVIGPGVAGECGVREGMHVQEDHFIVECLDPKTLEPVPEGEVGELVITSLTKEATPVLRYRTRDLAALDRRPCPCGRTGVRMGRVVGRSDDMLIIRGVNVFPSQVEEALLRVDGTAPQYLIEVSRPGALDEVKVKVELRPGDLRDEMRQMIELKDRIDREIHAVTGIRMSIELVAPGALERSPGKARRVIDHRKAAVA